MDQLPTAAELRGIPEYLDWSWTTRTNEGKSMSNFTLVFGRGETMRITSTVLPKWPLQCQAWAKKANRQCTKRANPGMSVCGNHCEHSMRPRIEGTRRYLMWVVSGQPTLVHPQPWVEFLTIEAVATELLRRERPIVPDKTRLHAATLLLKCTEWIDQKTHRSRITPKKALAEAGFDPVQVELAYETLHQAGWLPEVLPG